MTSVEAGGIIVAVLFLLCSLSAYVLYRMGAELRETVDDAVTWLRGEPRGERR